MGMAQLLTYDLNVAPNTPMSLDARKRTLGELSSTSLGYSEAHFVSTGSNSDGCTRVEDSILVRNSSRPLILVVASFFTIFLNTSANSGVKFYGIG